MGRKNLNTVVFQCSRKQKRQITGSKIITLTQTPKLRVLHYLVKFLQAVVRHHANKLEHAHMNAHTHTKHIVPLAANH